MPFTYCEGCLAAHKSLAVYFNMQITDTQDFATDHCHYIPRHKVVQVTLFSVDIALLELALSVWKPLSIFSAFDLTL